GRRHRALSSPDRAFGALADWNRRERVQERALSTPLVEVAERNHFFRLSAYGPALRELIASRRLRIVPDAREREVLQFIDRGLADISISRDADRSGGWGIPYPGDSTQVIYVWIDALVNYLTGVGFPDGQDVQRFWSEARTCHVIGKNVWKF